MFQIKSKFHTGKNTWANKVNTWSFTTMARFISRLGGIKNDPHVRYANRTFCNSGVISRSMLGTYPEVGTFHWSDFENAETLQAKVIEALYEEGFDQVEPLEFLGLVKKGGYLCNVEFTLTTSDCLPPPVAKYLCFVRKQDDEYGNFLLQLSQPTQIPNTNEFVMFVEYCCEGVSAFSTAYRLDNSIPVVLAEALATIPESYATKRIAEVVDETQLRRKMWKDFQEVIGEDDRIEKLFSWVQSHDLVREACPNVLAYLRDYPEQCLTGLFQEFFEQPGMEDVKLAFSKYASAFALSSGETNLHVNNNALSIGQQLRCNDENGVTVSISRPAGYCIFDTVSTVIFDSLQSFEYCNNGNGLGPRGMSIGMLKTLNRFTFSNVIFLHAPTPEIDPLSEISIDNYMTGELTVALSTDQNDFGEYYLGSDAWYTSRFTGRGISHAFTTMRAGMYISLSLVSSENPNERLLQVKSADSGVLLYNDLVDTSKLLQVNASNKMEVFIWDKIEEILTSCEDLEEDILEEDDNNE